MTENAAVTTGLSAGILTVRLTAPATRNAQTPGLWQALAEIGRTLDPSVRAVVLCADGPSFSAGLDRRMLTPEGIPGEGSMLGFAGMPAADLDALISTFQDAFRWWRRGPVVTVAAVQGHAVGAGFQLALACDLMVVAEDVQLAMKEPALGLVPDLGGTLPLVAAVGYSRALEIVASTRAVGADEAVRIGLALRAVPAADLEAAALAVARSCATAWPDAIAGSKALLADAAVRAAGTAPGTTGGWAAAHDAQLAAERGKQGDRIRALVAMLSGVR
jgi:enoyl-CoA hydratase/carnithine racemase